MPSFLTFALITTLFLSPQHLTTPITQGTLVVEVDNIEKNQGSVLVAIYQEVGFLKKTIIGKTIPVDGNKKIQVKMPNLPFGKYAIAIRHDVNSNNKLDKNILGVPKEPYGFSNGITAKWGEPKFYEVKVDFRQDKQRFKTKLNYWKDL